MDLFVHAVGGGGAARCEPEQPLARDRPRRHVRRRGDCRGSCPTLERTALADDTILANSRYNAPADRDRRLAFRDDVALERLAPLDAQPIAGLEAHRIRGRRERFKLARRAAGEEAHASEQGDGRGEIVAGAMRDARAVVLGARAERAPPYGIPAGARA